MSDEKPQSDHSLFIVIGFSAAAYLSLSVLNDFFAQPLRELSSVIAYYVLKLFSFPVIRMGTILETPNLRFDVIPACNGSSTLKVLMALGIFWSGTYKNLSFLKRVFCSIMSIPIALIINGFRVGALVALSHIFGEPIAEGPLHNIVGLTGFSIALLLFFTLTEAIAKSDFLNKSLLEKHKWWMLHVIMGLIYMPFLITCFVTWRGREFDSFDQIGYLFWLVFIFITKHTWKKHPGPLQPSKKNIGVLLFYLCLSLSVISFFIDLKYLLGISLMVYLLSLVWMQRGWRPAIAFMPLLGIFYLGFPKITLQINAFTSKILGISSWDFGWFVRLLLLLLFWTASIKLYRRLIKIHENETSPKEHPAPLKSLLAVAILTLALQVYINSQPKFEKMNSKLELSYYLNGWVGQKAPIGKQSITYFGQSNIWSRSYTKDGKLVQILINASGGNRHRNHPPEYCMTGNGWEIVESSVEKLTTGNFSNTNLTKMKMQKNEATSYFYYWFTDGENSYPNYFHLMIEDSKRRLLGKKTNWYLMRVISQNQKDLVEFLPKMDYKVYQ